MRVRAPSIVHLTLKLNVMEDETTEEDKIVGQLSMDYKVIKMVDGKKKYVRDDEGNPIVKQYDLDLDRRHLAVLKTLMMEREKVVASANIGNVTKAQEKDKMLKKIYSIMGY